MSCHFVAACSQLSGKIWTNTALFCIFCHYILYLWPILFHHGQKLWCIDERMGGCCQKPCMELWNWWFSTCSWKSAGFCVVNLLSICMAFVSFTEWPICSCKMAWWKTLQKHSPVMLGYMHPCACDSNRPNFNTWSPKSIYIYIHMHIQMHLHMHKLL